MKLLTFGFVGYDIYFCLNGQGKTYTDHLFKTHYLKKKFKNNLKKKHN